MERTPIFFTSDWHVGHENVLKFDSRPFKSIEDMHRCLINNYNSTVPKKGICYFLGDVGLCGSEVLKSVISQLHGTKVMVLGNHDKGVEAMYKIGFNVVLYGATMQIAGQKVTLSHCPLLGIKREDTSEMEFGTNESENWHGESRPKHQIFTTPNYGQYHLHGHIHSPNHGKSTKIQGRQYDVGVVANNYKPVNIKDIESWIARTK